MNPEIVGVHCILELHECSACLLNDAQSIQAALVEASQRANSTLINLVVHQFEPHGITALALLAESHLSIHTWPERGYAAVDIFTCGRTVNPTAACQFLVEHFAAGHHTLLTVVRGSKALGLDQVQETHS